ncbi:efflux RND transporter periplasmic adaptor subunit [Sphingomonadaceae bacterium OTU29LAMAA1]|nr:efflux RND transporter periplasmic adaptor subunit [Sphingomonadaceae bacterium OTU29LAMAA1]
MPVDPDTLSKVRPVSGGGMDRVVARRGLSQRLKGGIVAASLAATGIGAYWLAPAADSQSIAASRLTISTVTDGRFEDFLPLRARVTPLVTVYLDAVEGGRVDQILVEDGAMVQQGQSLATLSNAELQLSVLARQTEVTQQINSMRSQELALAQSRNQNERDRIEAELAATKARRQYEVQAPLAARGFVAGRTFKDTTDDYAYQRRRQDVLRSAQATDERLQSSQLAQLRTSAASLNASLDIARGSLDALNLRAPVSGQLTAFSIQLGQSMSRGERIGQIDSVGRSKLVASVDEYYLGRVAPNQTASIDWNGKAYALKVAKIYPQVKNGAFEVDLVFTSGEPANLQRGQTMQTKLTLSDPAPARLLPNGAFYNDTGGSWVFVVAPDGRSAAKRSVRLGRRNSDVIEVLDGLDRGERVVTSPYTGLVDKTRLDLSAN